MQSAICCSVQAGDALIERKRTEWAIIMRDLFALTSSKKSVLPMARPYKMNAKRVEIQGHAKSK